MSSCCSEPGTAVRAGQFANYMILLLIILIMSTLLGDISTRGLCCSIQVPSPWDLHMQTHPDPFWGSQAVGNKPREVQGELHHPKDFPKQEGKRWEMGILRVLGTPWCQDSLELSPGMHPAPQGISGGFRGNWKGPLWFSSTHSPGAAPFPPLPGCFIA